MWLVPLLLISKTVNFVWRQFTFYFVHAFILLLPTLKSILVGSQTTCSWWAYQSTFDLGKETKKRWDDDWHVRMNVGRIYYLMISIKLVGYCRIDGLGHWHIDYINKIFIFSPVWQRKKRCDKFNLIRLFAKPIS